MVNCTAVYWRLIVDTDYRLQDTEYRTQNTEHRTQNTGYRLQVTGHRIQNYTGYKIIQNTGYI